MTEIRRSNAPAQRSSRCAGRAIPIGTENSVAATTEAQARIEKLLVNVYDRHLGHVGVSASQTWPQPFRQRRVGVFRLDFEKIVLPTSVVVFVKSDVERTAEIRARIGRGTSNRIDFPQGSSMSPIPGVPFSDFLEMFKISLEEMLPEIRSGRLAITIQTDTGDEGNKFITPAQFHAWVNNPQTPASLRNRAMARVKTKMN
jgi:hypothetical protein